MQPIPQRPPQEDRAFYAGPILTAMEKAVNGIIQTGLALIEAKGRLTTAAFKAMVIEELKIDVSTANKYMAAARNPVIADPARAHLLPACWTTLYILSSLSVEALENAIAKGTITPALRRDGARMLNPRRRKSPKPKRPGSVEPGPEPTPMGPGPEPEPQGASDQPDVEPLGVAAPEIQPVRRRPGRKSRKVQQAFDAYSLLRDRGEEPSEQAVAALAGVSRATAQRAILAHRLSGEPAAPVLPPDGQEALRAALDSEMRKLQMQFEADRRQLEAELEATIEARIRAKFDSLILPQYIKEIETAQAITRMSKGVLTKVEYYTLIKCLHPDAVHACLDIENPRHKDLLAELADLLGKGFHIVKAKEAVLLPGKDLLEGRPSASSLPRTVSEMFEDDPSFGQRKPDVPKPPRQKRPRPSAPSPG